MKTHLREKILNKKQETRKDKFICNENIFILMKKYMYGSSTGSSPARAFLMAWMIPADRNPDMIIVLSSSVSKKFFEA